MKSSEYREILIYVAGITPQIITETLYAFIIRNHLYILMRYL